MVNSFEKQLVDCIPKLRGFIFSLVRDRQLIDDIAQSALLNAWRARGTFKGDCKLSTWLYQIAKNEAALHYRKDKSGFHVDCEKLLDQPDGSQDTLSNYVCREMMQAYDRVTPTLDKLIAAESMRGGTCKTVAGKFGIPEGTVKSRRHRARQRLRKEPIFCQ